MDILDIEAYWEAYEWASPAKPYLQYDTRIYGQDLTPPGHSYSLQQFLVNVDVIVTGPVPESSRYNGPHHISVHDYFLSSRIQSFEWDTVDAKRARMLYWPVQ
jgi:hypothetical protein